jgi:predicted Zn-dependent protease
MRRRWLSILLVTALLGACATVTNPVTGKAERTVMDEASEVAEGRKAHPEILKLYGAYPDTKVQAYVNELGQRLAKHSHRQNLEWHFTVLDSPEVNAFALPGGYVYVTRGIMAYMDSEADLAGVIGHEIGHVTARHGSQRATREQTAGLGVLAATILGMVLEGRGVGGAADLASQVSQGVAAGYIASYSRDQESQADRLGAEYLARTSYNPKNMVDVIGVLQNQERFAEETARAEGRAPQQRASWLDSHPSNDKRLADLRQIASQYQGKYGDDGRARYLQAVNGLAFGESREQGVVRGRNFYHEPLGIALSAPEGWKIVNSPQAITLANAAGDAGLIVNLVPPEAGGSHAEIIRNLLRPEQGRADKEALNSFPATRFVVVRRNEQGQAQGIEGVVVTGPGNRNYLLIHAARDVSALQRASAEIRQAEASFRAMSRPDQAAARPWAIKTVPYPAGGFPELARRSPLLSFQEQQLRLLNGFYPGGEPQPGQPVKTVE